MTNELIQSSGFNQPEKSESQTDKGADRSALKRERLVLIIEPVDTERQKCQDSIFASSPLYDVDAAATAQEGLDLFASKNYDVVVMSYDLHDIAPDKLIKNLLKLNSNCAIVVTTATDSAELAFKVLRAGALDYLPKIGEYQKFLPRTITTNLQRAVLIENLKDMFTRVEQAQKDEALLNRLIINIHSSLDMSNTIEKATESLIEEFDASRAILCLLNDANDTMKIRRQITRDVAPISDRSPLFERYLDLLLDIGERRPLVVRHDDSFPFAQDVKTELFKYKVLSLIMVPLVYRGKLMGLIHLDHSHTDKNANAKDNPRVWSASESGLLTRISHQLAIAISQAKLHEIVETQNSSIQKLTELCGTLSKVVESTQELAKRSEGHEKIRVKLSERELEVLKMVAQGLSNKDIAESLHITEGTTEVHVSRLRKKLNLTSRAAIVRYAYENHLS
ncbi:MAG: response regulator [Cyanobacteria bacterium TGS_CYA1]|nr:response regulator [Cyanobacteria bacterium TGS_CYA1]